MSLEILFHNSAGLDETQDTKGRWRGIELQEAGGTREGVIGDE
jgi:hypothetical protein